MGLFSGLLGGGGGGMLGGLSGGSATGGGNAGSGLSSGGIGNSSSSTTNTSDSSEHYLTSGNNGVNANQETRIAGNNNTITMTDLGAVSQSLALAMRGIEGTNALAAQIQASNGGILDGALQNSRQQMSEFTSALEKVKTSDIRVLIFTGLGVIGVVAVVMFNQKKGG